MGSNFQLDFIHQIFRIFYESISAIFKKYRLHTTTIIDIKMKLFSRIENIFRMAFLI